jgi:hypothetical protein
MSELMADNLLTLFVCISSMKCKFDVTHWVAKHNLVLVAPISYSGVSPVKSTGINKVPNILLLNVNTWAK